MRILLILIMLAMSLPSKKYLFIGDSLTCYSGGWQEKLTRAHGAALTNHAMGGKRTDWMKRRLFADLDTATWDRVYIYGGINDAFAEVNLDSSVSNIMQCVQRCKSKGVEPIVIIGYDPLKVNLHTGYSAEVEAKCRARYCVFQSKLIAAITGRAKYIPMDTTLTRADSDDGVHLNASGHRKFSKWIIDHNK